MTLESIYYVGQTIASGAVVLSLFYLAIQARQTERKQRALMQQARTDRGIGLSICFPEPEMADLIVKIQGDSQDLTAHEQVRLITYCRSLALNLLDACALRDMKYLSDEAFERATAGAKWFLAIPQARATWGRVRRQFTTADASLIEKLVIDGICLSLPVDFAAAGKDARKATREAQAADVNASGGAPGEAAQ